MERPDGELQVHGSCEFARGLHEAGLIDEYRLLVFPVCVGAGKRLFTDSAPATGFTLVTSRTTSTGAVYSALTPIPFTVGGIEVVNGKDTFVRDVASDEASEPRRSRHCGAPARSLDRCQETIGLRGSRHGLGRWGVTCAA